MHVWMLNSMTHLSDSHTKIRIPSGRRSMSFNKVSWAKDQLPEQVVSKPVYL